MAQEPLYSVNPTLPEELQPSTGFDIHPSSSTTSSSVVYSDKTDLPNSEYGIIKLEYLEKIREALVESSAPQDQGLVTWINVNYLNSPRFPEEYGRKIETQESFHKLLESFRRARNLTDRQYDKWPFFDKRWKPMPQKTVHKLAGVKVVKGELEPLDVTPGMNSQSPMIGTFFLVMLCS